MFFLRSVKHFLPQTALKSIYYAIIHSHFVYGIQIWSCTSPSNLNIRSVKQKAAVLIVNNSSYNSHTDLIFKSLNILPLTNLIEFFKIQFVHIQIHQWRAAWLIWLHLDQEWRPKGDGALLPQLRNHADIYIPPARLSSTDKSPLFNFPRIWGSFPEDSIKNLTSLIEFNVKLKAYFRENFP